MSNYCVTSELGTVRRENGIGTLQLSNFVPKNKGILDAEEVKTIETVLCVNKMDALQLRNLRDFAVLFLTHDEERFDIDKCSAIVGVIDKKLFDMGEEV